uniref:hypothetical protein n=1 Tax=Marinobacterium profundum TaxID=1714300 RepID=UPI001C1F4DD1
FYVPHRDEDIVKIDKISSLFNVDVKYLHMPAEVYFAEADYIPACISSAYSSSINNLKVMFEFKEVIAFKLPIHVVDRSHRQSILNVYDYFESINIRVLDLY